MNPDDHNSIAGNNDATADCGFYKKLLDDLGDGVYFVDCNRRIQYWNRGAERLTGYSGEEVIGHCCQDNLLSHVDYRGRPLCREGCPLTASIADGAFHEARVFLRHKEGRRQPVLVRVQPICDARGEIVGAVEVFSDNSAENESQRRLESLRRLAFLDHLTELPNRRFLEMTLGTALGEFAVHGDPFGLLLIDLDFFKRINDTCGHASGDAAIREIGRTMAAALRPTDTLGRWGGDEFLAIVRNVDRPTLQTLAERCVNLARETAVPGSHGFSLHMPVSVGATLALSGDRPEDLLHRVDQLLYQSKQAGRGRATVG